MRNMSPPLPIPSKAAIHALRGIALGTSCAIGVIVEDRRRRICTLETAVANKEKLRSSRQYHGSLDTLSSQLDDTDIFGGPGLPWQHRKGRGKIATRTLVNNADCMRPVPNIEHAEPPFEPLSSQGDLAPYTTPPAKEQPTHTVPPRKQALPRSGNAGIRSHSSWQSWPTSFEPRDYQRKGDTLIPGIIQGLEGNDEDRLQRAVDKFMAAPHLHYFKHQSTAWLGLSARLSKECQSAGKWQEASDIVARIVDSGVISESQFYHHNPIPIMDFHLRRTKEKRPCSLKAVSRAAKILFATFGEKPRSHAADIERIGRKLITEALCLNQPLLVQKAYWRVLNQLDDSASFVGKVIQQLHEHHDHKNVIKYFLLNFSKLNPDEAVFNLTLDCVVGSVQAMGGYRASQVMHAYTRMNCPGAGKLRTRWVMKLLQAHWRRHEDIALSRTLFDEVQSLGLLEMITHPEGAYRAMVEIAVRAGDHELAYKYYNELIKKFPDMISDVPLRGIMAVAEAKAGNWDGVDDVFVKLAPLLHQQRNAYDDAFVMVLKVFAQAHPVADVREFVTKYFEQRNVRMHRYIVTIVANKYGECHDVSGFMSWLVYCSGAGFALDAAFCNSVLHNCRTSWNLSFSDLQRLHRQMQSLNPEFEDEVTRRIMSQAVATKGPRRGGSAVFQRHTRPNVVTVSKSAYHGRTTDKREIYEAMNQEISSGRPRAAIIIYKKALKYGMAACSHCLRRAVTAALQPKGGGPGSALTLIHAAHQQKQDIGPAVSAFLRLQLNHFQGAASDVLRHMQDLVSRFEALQIIIEPEVLTHMAVVCVKIGQHEKAMALCTMARKRLGVDNLCFSKQSFKALVMACSQIQDAQGLATLIDHLVASKIATDSTVLAQLKSTRRQVQKLEHSEAVAAVLDELERGIKHVLHIRAEQRREGKMISRETLRIMNDALVDMQDEEMTVKPPEPALQDIPQQRSQLQEITAGA
ncbi:hypothetical protein F4778DRAFT_210833 [Xylariomycetidae sp. FL2044]|nr:hypothetical protein F4778DRAFT_210833 [Xylariomycetidae sp. FL2044]